jgi:4-hydroxy-3-methylbut-2-enyl diphosphate reductase
MREIIMADKLGFCFGVRRAVDEIINSLAGDDPVWSIGMPIHNPQEVERLKARGLKVVGDAAEIPGEAGVVVKVLVRAHGE